MKIFRLFSLALALTRSKFLQNEFAFHEDETKWIWNSK